MGGAGPGGAGRGGVARARRTHRPRSDRSGLRRPTSAARTRGPTRQSENQGTPEHAVAGHGGGPVHGAVLRAHFKTSGNTGKMPVPRRKHGQDARATSESRARCPCHVGVTGKMPVPRRNHGQDARATSETRARCPCHVGNTGKMPVPRRKHGQDARATSIGVRRTRRDRNKPVTVNYFRRSVSCIPMATGNDTPTSIRPIFRRLAPIHFTS
jgi:hypothetical protein